MKTVKWFLMPALCAMLLFGCSKLTRENYDKVKMGMSMDEVTGILGEPSSCSGALGARQCIWGDKEKNIIITFMGDQVVLPAMKGL